MRPFQTLALVLRDCKHWFNSKKNTSLRVAKGNISGERSKNDISPEKLLRRTPHDDRKTIGLKDCEFVDENDGTNSDSCAVAIPVSLSSEKSPRDPTSLTPITECSNNATTEDDCQAGWSISNSNGVEDNLQSPSMCSNIDTTAIALLRLDRRHHDAMELDRKHRKSDKPVWPTVNAYQEKRNTRLRTA